MVKTDLQTWWSWFLHYSGTPAERTGPGWSVDDKRNRIVRTTIRKINRDLYYSLSCRLRHWGAASTWIKPGWCYDEQRNRSVPIRYSAIARAFRLQRIRTAQ